MEEGLEGPQVLGCKFEKKKKLFCKYSLQVRRIPYLLLKNLTKFKQKKGILNDI